MMQIANIAPPTPIVIPTPVIVHIGTRPANASFQHITALYTPWLSGALELESGSTARTSARPVAVFPVPTPNAMIAFSNHSSLQKSLQKPRAIASVSAQQIDIKDTVNKYYISVTAANTPGVIGSIGEICGRHNISLASVLQKELTKKIQQRLLLLQKDVKNRI